MGILEISFIKKHRIISLILAYFMVGLVHYLSFELYFFILGKETAFSPVIGMPMTLLFWPMFLYADLYNANALGIRFPDVLTLILIIASAMLFAKNWMNR